MILRGCFETTGASFGQKRIPFLVDTSSFAREAVITCFLGPGGDAADFATAAFHTAVRAFAHPLCGTLAGTVGWGQGCHVVDDGSHESGGGRSDGLRGNVTAGELIKERPLFLLLKG